MRKTSLWFSLSLACGLLPHSANAQLSRSAMGIRQSAIPTTRAATARAAATTTVSETACQYFLDTPFPKTVPKDYATAVLPKLTECKTALLTNIPDPAASGSSLDNAVALLKTNYNISTPDQVNEQLITTHYLARVLRRWANLDKTQTTLLGDLSSLDGRLHSLMSYVGLLDPLAGSLVAGPVMGVTGKLANGTTSTSTTGGATTTTTGTAATSNNSTTNALAHIEWGSKHLLDATADDPEHDPAELREDQVPDHWQLRSRGRIRPASGRVDLLLPAGTAVG